MNIDELEKLNELKEKGIISQKEFDEKKKEILEASDEIDLCDLNNETEISNVSKNSPLKTIIIICFVFLCIYLFVESIFPQTIQCADHISQKACECMQFAVAKNFSFMEKVRVLLIGASAEEVQAYLNVGDALLCAFK